MAEKKRRLWLLGVPVLLLVLLVVAVKIYFTDERLRDMIVPEIESATGRTAGLESVSLSLFPSVGISLTGFTLSNPPGGGFTTPGFLSVGEVFIDVRLMPLFSGTVQIDKVILTNPDIRLETTPEGAKNYRTAGAAAGAADSSDDAYDASGAADPAVPPTGAGSPAAVLLSNLEIRGGRIASSNRRLDSRWEIDSLDAVLVVTPAPGAISAAATWTMKSLSYGTQSSWYLSGLPLDGKAQLDYSPGADRLTMSDVQASLRDVGLTLSGTIDGIQRETMEMDLSISSPGLTVAQLLSLLSPDLLKASEGLDASGDVSFSMIVKGDFDDDVNPGVTSKFSLRSGRIRYSSLPKSIENLAVEGTIAIPQAPNTKKDIGTFELSKFTATLGSGSIEGRLKATNLDKPAIDALLRAKFPLAEVKDYYPLPEGTDLRGNFAIDASMKGPVDAPKTIRASGTMTLDGVTIVSPAMTRPVRDLSGSVTFKDQTLEVKNLAMTIGESDLALDATVRNYTALMFDDASLQPHATVRLVSRKLRTSDIATAPEADPDAGGASGAGNSPSGAASPPKEETGLLIPGMNSEGTLRIDSLVTENFVFTNAKGSFSFIDGILTLNGFGLDAFSGSVTSKGTVNFSNPSTPAFDLKLDIADVESHDFLAPVTTFGQYLFGTLDLSVSMTGRLDEESELDPQSLTGAGSAKISMGTQTWVPALQSVSTLLNVPELKELDFESWTQKFSVADGKLKIEDLKIAAEGADIGITGLHGLDGSLDYAMGVRLPKSLTDKIKIGGVGNELLKYFKEPDGTMKLDFNVGGTVGSPALSLNTKAQEERLKKDLLDQATKNLKEPAKNLLEGLKKLIKPKN